MISQTCKQEDMKYLDPTRTSQLEREVARRETLKFSISRPYLLRIIINHAICLLNPSTVLRSSTIKDEYRQR